MSWDLNKGSIPYIKKSRCCICTGIVTLIIALFRKSGKYGRCMAVNYSCEYFLCSTNVRLVTFFNVEYHNSIALTNLKTQEALRQIV